MSRRVKDAALCREAQAVDGNWRQARGGFPPGCASRNQFSYAEVSGRIEVAGLVVPRKSRNRLIAEAYGQDPDFFAFYRSMSAYEVGLRSSDTRFLLRPDSDFFKFFSNSSGKPPVAAAPKP